MTMGLPQDSATFARESLAAILSAPAPASLVIAGRRLDVLASSVDDGCAVRARWEDGALRLRFEARVGKTRRHGVPEDGPGVTLWGGCGDKNRELFSVGFEWVIRDAIRTGSSDVALVAQNTVLGTLKDTKARPDIGAWRARGRDLAAAAGLRGYPDVALGTLEIRTGLWTPSPALVLQRLLTLSVIKANCIRDARPVVERQRLFNLEHP